MDTSVVGESQTFVTQDQPGILSCESPVTKANNKVALITGINGQDGSYLAELLVEKGYTVHGIIRRHSFSEGVPANLYVVRNNVKLHYADLTDPVTIRCLIEQILPDEIYNLGAQSHVAVSFKQPVYTANVNALGPIIILDAIKSLKDKKEIRFYQASTSEMFGEVTTWPQDENTRFKPISPYAIAKLFAHHTTINYRESYGLFACSGILFNHESPRRTGDFVTQKIVRGIQAVVDGVIPHIELGNLDSLRDWGHAKDYVQAMWLMLQSDKADDYVIATGIQHSVREFVEMVCAFHDFEIEWRGAGVNEVGVYKDRVIFKERVIVKVNPEYYRPSDVVNLVGCNYKAQQELGWKPEYTLDKLVKEMCSYETYNIRCS